MLMTAKNRRLQVLVEEDQYRRLEREASERGVSVATVVREALDEKLPTTRAARRAAAAAIHEAQPMQVGDPSELRLELEELRGRPG